MGAVRNELYTIVIRPRVVSVHGVSWRRLDVAVGSVRAVGEIEKDRYQLEEA